MCICLEDRSSRLCPYEKYYLYFSYLVLNCEFNTLTFRAGIQKETFFFFPSLTNILRAQVLEFSTIDILCLRILCCRACPVHCRIFGSLCIREGSNTLLSPLHNDNKNVSRHCKYTLGAIPPAPSSHGEPPC